MFHHHLLGVDPSLDVSFSHGKVICLDKADAPLAASRRHGVVGRVPGVPATEMILGPYWPLVGWWTGPQG